MRNLRKDLFRQLMHFRQYMEICEPCGSSTSIL